MYHQQDFDRINAQIKREALILAAICVPLIVAIIASFVVRIEWLTILLTIACGAIGIFMYNMRLSPLTAYSRYLKDVTTGLQRETVGPVVSYSSDLSFKEGVQFHILMLNIDPKMDPEGERLFYYDAYKPSPGVTPGMQVHVVSHGNYVIGIDVLSS